MAVAVIGAKKDNDDEKLMSGLKTGLSLFNSMKGMMGENSGKKNNGKISAAKRQLEKNKEY